MSDPVNKEGTREAEPPVQQIDVAEIARKAAEEAAEKVRKEFEEREAKRAAFRKEVEFFCELSGVRAIDECVAHADGDIEKAREWIREKRKVAAANATRDVYIDMGADAKDKHTDAIRSAFLTKAYQDAGVDPTVREKLDPEAKRAAGWEDFRHMSPMEIAQECLRMDGFNLRGLNRVDIAQLALTGRMPFGMRASTAVSTGYNVVGTFPQLTLDAFNKTMLAGYMQYPMTWSRCFRQAPSARDFKNLNRIRLGEIPNLEVWPTNQVMNQVSMADEKESYAVESFADEISFSWKLLVNDDMDALTRVPMMLGVAAARTVNSAAWSVITANGNLQDGVALFATATGSRKKDNYTSSGAAPSVTEVAKGKNLMRQQVGVNKPDATASDQILNITPSYLIVPSALETVGAQLVNSQYDPASSKFQVFNPFTGLELIVEPLLDSNSTTAWYLAATPALIDTIEVTFLQGQENPVVRNYMDDKTWAQVFQVVQTFAAKAIDFRGLYKNAGA